MKHIKPLPTFTKRDIFNFWERVDKNQSDKGCWIWIGAKSLKGYGLLDCKNKRGVKAHRISFHLAGGGTTEDKPLVCHGPCHNPSCVNPDHLEAGSSKKNIHDKERDGTKITGVRVHCSKLNPEKVRLIRDKFANGTASSVQLGKEYKVDPSIILDAVYRRTWDHVDYGQPVKLPSVQFRDSAKGSRNGSAKITEETVREIRRLRKERWILREISQKFNLSITNVHDIITRKIWAHIDPDEPLPEMGQYHT